MDLQAVLDAFLRVELAIGLACGVAALVVTGLAPPIRRSGWGLPVVVAAGAGFALAGLLTWTVPGEPGWLRPVSGIALVAVALTVAAGAGVAGWRRVLPGLVVLSVGGVFVTVPDTEGALVLLGATAPLAAAAGVTAWPLGRLGGLGLGGLLVWVVATHGAPRPGSVVGGLACLGVLAFAPVAGGTARGRLGWRAGTVLVVGHGGAVLLAGRVAGMRQEAVDALPWAVVALVVAYATVLAADWLSGGPDRATLPRAPRSAGLGSREQRDRDD